MPSAGSTASELTATTVLAVAAGAVVGTAARHGMALALPTAPGDVPWATLIINVAGSLTLGLLAGRLDRRSAAAWVRPLLATGVLGSFTTYSTFAVETATLLALRPAVAAAYVAASLVLGCAAAVAGLRWAGR